MIIMHEMVTEIGNGSQLPMLAIKKGVCIEDIYAHNQATTAFGDTPIIRQRTK